jgi:hypothetical protein
MKRFWKDDTGSAPIWAAFLILLLFTLSVIVYSGVMIYAKYQTCETEVQRAATIAVDRNLFNANVRDLELDVPAASAKDDFYDNLTQTGWAMEGGCWNRYEDRHLICSLEDMKVEIEGQTMQIGAKLAIPLPWDIGGMLKVHIPVSVRSSVLYID